MPEAALMNIKYAVLTLTYPPSVGDGSPHEYLLGCDDVVSQPSNGERSLMNVKNLTFAIVGVLNFQNLTETDVRKITRDGNTPSFHFDLIRMRFFFFVIMVFCLPRPLSLNTHIFDSKTK